MADQALTGISVLDLSEGAYGYCTKLMADYGAEVIKIEKPGVGDAFRSVGPFKDDDPHPEKSGLFLWLNTNKKSITLNLASADGRGIFKELVKGADCLVESSPPGTMESLGLDYPNLERINPKLVMASITPFGQTGPYKDYKGSDLILQALTGAVVAQGRADREPLRTPGYVAEFFAAAGAALPTLAAIHLAQDTGEGQYVDVGALETQTLMTNLYAMMYVYMGVIRPRGYPRLGTISKTKDSYIGVNLLTQWFWEKLCQVVGREDLIKEPKYATPTLRAMHDNELGDIIEPLLMEHTSEELFHKTAGEMQYPMGLVPTVAELLELEQHKARGFFVEVDHPVMGKTTIPGAPNRPYESPWQLRSPAPLLGQHNKEVYGRLGYSGQDLVQLRERGVI